jgi:hypothetical protein
MAKTPELLEDSLYLLALHIADDPSEALLSYAADLIDRCKEADSPEDHATIKALRDALEGYGIPLCAVEISLLGKGFGE